MGQREEGERFVLGMAVGVAIGAATGNMALWTAIGAVMGVVFAEAARRRACMERQRSNESRS